MQKKVMLLAVFLLSFLGVVAWLASPSMAQSVDPQCIDEIEKQCGDIEPGMGRIQRCFDANIGKFSPMCQTQLSEGKADAAAGISGSRQAKGQQERGKTDAVGHTHAAIQILTDYPGQGKRYSAYKTPDDFVKSWGADVRNADEAVTHLNEALNQASGNANATRQLTLARDYAKARLHKEARLSAQGGLHYLCAGSSDDKCKNVPKFGSYVAP